MNSIDIKLGINLNPGDWVVLKNGTCCQVVEEVTQDELKVRHQSDTIIVKYSNVLKKTNRPSSYLSSNKAELYPNDVVLFNGIAWSIEDGPDSTGRIELINSKGEKVVANKNNVKLAPLDSKWFDWKTYNNDMEIINNSCGWVKAPKCLRNILPFDERKFLEELIDHAFFIVKPEILSKLKGWFSFNQKAMKKRLGISYQVQKRLIDALKKKGFLQAKIKNSKVKTPKNKKQKYKTRRLLRIDMRIIRSFIPEKSE